MKRFTLIACIVGCALLPAFAGDGMWLPLLLKQLNEKDMQALGMKMTAEDIYSVNKGSLKDAIVHFGGGCTGEIISPKGLLLTNHHCGYGRIQSHSTLEKNYIEDGFWAKNQSEELPNPGLFVTFLVRMEDVTASVMQGVRPDMPASERQSLIDKNIDQVKKVTSLQPHEEVAIKPYFEGNQYYMLVTMTYRDVRLVGAPPAAIGNFGVDTDNWVWPRHTGDFSLFRIYAGPDNMPADYSPDNVPYTPKHYLPISMDGVKEGDFTLVFGYPGLTNQYLPSMAIRQIMEVTDPIRISMRDQSLAILNEAMRKDPQVKIQYVAKYAGIANGWKKWQGEVQGLRSKNAVQKKERDEEAFYELALSRPEWKSLYGNLLMDFKNLYGQLAPYQRAYAYYTELVSVNVELFRVAAAAERMVSGLANNGPKGYEDQLGRMKALAGSFYPDYQPWLDQKVFSTLMQTYLSSVDTAYLPQGALAWTGGDAEAWAGKLYGSTIFTDPGKLESVLAMNPKDAVKAIEADPFYQLYQELKSAFSSKVQVNFNALNQQIKDLQRVYMRAQMELFPKKRFFPDANGTLRVAYGQVSGYKPRDGVSYAPVTYLDGVMEKYVPGDYEFDVPAKLQDLYRRKDYGKYGENGRMPVCFIANNHTSGGNSGSPAINANGHLIGLNFDRVWEGTMSDYYFDPSICRNIMVDIRYILFLIDKYAGAGYLIEEMKLVSNYK